MPWVIMVDSSATIGFCVARASATSLFVSINLREKVSIYFPSPWNTFIIKTYLERKVALLLLPCTNSRFQAFILSRGVLFIRSFILLHCK